jgi:galactokinase
MTLLSERIPQFKVDQVEAVYTNDIEKQQIRFKSLRDKFQAEFGKQPDFIARSPGRVNLIGEHVDYAGYSVLPMAIEKDCVMAVGVEVGQKPHVTLANINAKYPTRSFEHEADGHVTIDPAIHEWSNYFKCGYKGVLDELNPSEVVSMKVMVDGTVPPGSGLSSSSAFVCCASLATLHAHKSIMNKGQLTKAAIKSETYAGVQIGGMDQSISIMAPKDSALLIDFYPALNATAIKFPSVKPAPVFVIANTMVTADKHVTAPTNYNLRVVETRLAAALLRKKLMLKMREGVITLKQVQESYLGLEQPLQGLEKLLTAVEEHIAKKPYTLDAIAQELGISVDEMKKVYVGSIQIRADYFKLNERAKHVYSESKLVYEFKRICSLAPVPSNVLNQLGDLMNQSHYSCRDFFQCSCPELDELTELCRTTGAYGSRLTGAGWGGCTVSLVDEDRVQEFMKTIKEKYYVKRNPEMAQQDISHHLFSTYPSIGAVILE